MNITKARIEYVASSDKATLKKGDIIIEETELKGIDEKEFDV